MISNSETLPTLKELATIRAEQNTDPSQLKITLPTGRIQEKVLKLLNQIGVSFQETRRSYRPVCSDSTLEAKFLKAQSIPELVALGRHDCGFTGHDWIVEQEADVLEILDLGFDPVRIVVAVPEETVDLIAGGGRNSTTPLVVASEYRRLAVKYIHNAGLNAVFVQSFGATEALPPEDADIIIDNTASGTTLSANRLVIVEEIMRSTTRFICNKESFANPEKRRKLEEMKMLMQSTIQAQSKVLLEMNVANEDFQRLATDLPCMRAPTVSQLYNGDGYAIKIAVPSADVPQLIPRLVALGAKDILEYRLEKIVG